MTLKIHILTILVFIGICNTTVCAQTIDFAGSKVVDTVLVAGNCETSLYKYTIDIRTYGIPDAFQVILPDSNIIADTKFFPCAEWTLTSSQFSECRNGFFTYYNDSLVYGPIPSNFAFEASPPYESCRIVIAGYYPKIILRYIGNTMSIGTIATIKISTIEVKDTIVTYSNNTACDSIWFFNKCVDSVVVGKQVILADEEVCFGDSLYLYFPDTVFHIWEDGYDYDHYIVPDEDITISCTAFYEYCSLIFDKNIDVIVPSTPDTIILKENEAYDTNLFLINNTWYYRQYVQNCIFETPVILHKLNKSKVYIPNAFSPNGDGINDEFCIYFDEFYVKDVLELTIFNRWGGIVYDGNECWDGVGNDIGVYVIFLKIINYQNKLEVFTNDLTLIK